MHNFKQTNKIRVCTINFPVEEFLNMRAQIPHGTQKKMPNNQTDVRRE